MTAVPSIDREDVLCIPGWGLTQVSTGVCDCLCMGSVGSCPGDAAHATGRAV